MLENRKKRKRNFRSDEEYFLFNLRDFESQCRTEPLTLSIKSLKNQSNSNESSDGKFNSEKILKQIQNSFANSINLQSNNIILRILLNKLNVFPIVRNTTSSINNKLSITNLENQNLNSFNSVESIETNKEYHDNLEKTAENNNFSFQTNNLNQVNKVLSSSIYSSNFNQFPISYIPQTHNNIISFNDTEFNSYEDFFEKDNLAFQIESNLENTALNLHENKSRYPLESNLDSNLSYFHNTFRDNQFSNISPSSIPNYNLISQSYREENKVIEKTTECIESNSSIVQCPEMIPNICRTFLNGECNYVLRCKIMENLFYDMNSHME